MTITKRFLRPLGTMVVAGHREGDLSHDLEIAQRLGASVVEILPDWKHLPDPKQVRRTVEDAGMTIHSAHGCWGGQTIRATRVDLGDLNPQIHDASVDDLKQCVDWLAEVGGTCLVVHPGGLSAAEQIVARTDALARGLTLLARHARGTSVILCVENMPPGVYPGSRMAEVAAVVSQLALAPLALAVDTGHANLSAKVQEETLEAGAWLRTTHVHDNEGRKDSHLPPGLGSVDWEGWVMTLDAIEYRGPIMLECIRHFREHPESLNSRLTERLSQLTTSSLPDPR